MDLTEHQIDGSLAVWNEYIKSGGKIVNAGQEYSNTELDQQRLKIIPEIIVWLNKFLINETTIEEFKTAIDGINKRNRLWGFSAIKGQMFFNILAKNSQIGGQLKHLTSLLKRTLPVPNSIEDAKNNIEEFSEFTQKLGQYSQDLRGAPKTSSILYFLSYFWQIQSSEKYPVYYTSMINVFGELDIWSPIGKISEDYAFFYKLNHQLLHLFSKQEGKQLHLWDVEHAFWHHNRQSQKQSTEVNTPSEKSINQKRKRVVEGDLPESYIPPIVSILPKLAFNDPGLSEICKRSGKMIEKVFEERLAILFRMLGYEVELLGQGHGRVPDGIALSQEFHYAIIYDAKIRQQAYTMGTDERAFREYIKKTGEKLRKRGLSNLYFMVVSSSFSGDHNSIIRSLKLDTDVKEVLLVEINVLLSMLEIKLRNSNISLGPEGIQWFLASSGLLSINDIRELWDI